MPISTVSQKGLDAPLTLTSPVLTTPNLGTPSALVLTNATGLPAGALPAGCIRQVVTGTKIGQLEASFSGGQDLGLTATLTPASSSNKILILANLNACSARGGGTYWTCTLQKSVGGGAWTDVIRVSDYCGYEYQANAPLSTSYLDSPATTSSVAYRFFGNRTNGSANCYSNLSDNSATKNTQTITLLEVVG